MRFPLDVRDLSLTVTDTWTRTGDRIADYLTPSLRLGVTGLARSGKTVFITTLIRNLTQGGRLPFFAPYADGRLMSANLEPQPDDEIPRFDYEAHIAALSAAPPDWPESTRRISEVRVALAFTPEHWLRRSLGIRRLNLDIVDYPGEWLLDLAMLNQNYADWSREALERARLPSRETTARDWLTYLATLDPDASEDEKTALTGAQLFTRYLTDARRDAAVATLGPGRFLMPGDLEGSPLLTFFPLDVPHDATPRRGSLHAMMARRYDSYVAHVVRPFFRDHFSRLDRQIVLVDVLGALAGGPEGVAELESALASVLGAFRPGVASWLASLVGARRIDRLLFAATKADHIHHTSHDRLEAILRLLTQRAAARAGEAGAETRVMALAALRATREAQIRDGGNALPCIVGVPLPGETVSGERFDGQREVAIFPGDLPEDPAAVLSGKSMLDTAFPRFRPPRLLPTQASGEMPSPPHIRLDRALDFLIGDWLP
ncbi:ATP/GTP-binding protein [Hyphomicrobium nitrativorans NL23]|uniref:ATP/GTP-binding protein n=1 Tax=Hyphomicrobium nitrativorans NL23 TaxID=1029756 RepID=V5SEJ9_9HYPH|nr:YcjX family protein [Hyphomicrobium nitrativorans]AHB48953.1 ATP/GTP-binding protein [Hyphomicrobium nitrativorans NL23]